MNWPRVLVSNLREWERNAVFGIFFSFLFQTPTMDHNDDNVFFLRGRTFVSNCYFMHVVTESGRSRALECDERTAAEIQSSPATDVPKSHRNDTYIRMSQKHYTHQHQPARLLTKLEPPHHDSTSQFTGHIETDFPVGAGDVLQMDWVNSGLHSGVYFLGVLTVIYCFSCSSLQDPLLKVPQNIPSMSTSGLPHHSSCDALETTNLAALDSFEKTFGSYVFPQ